MSTLSLTLGVSIAIHAALLTVRFVAPEQFNRVFQDTPLEVILVNAQTQERPEKAQAIAQAVAAELDRRERARSARARSSLHDQE